MQNDSNNRQWLGHKKVKITYNPKSNYISVPRNSLCTHRGSNSHLKDLPTIKLKAIWKNIKYDEKIRTMKFGSSFVKTRLPRWTKTNLIHHLTQKKGPKPI